MSQVLQQPTRVERSRFSPAMWRLAGGLAIAHVVLLFAGFSQERSTHLGAGLADAQRAYAEGSLARSMVGGFVESFGFVLLLPVLVFLARAVGTRTEAARWASQTALVAGIAYVATTLAVGMPAGAAAMYGGHHGADLHTALMVIDIRNFSFFLSLMVLAAQAVGLGIAAYLDGFSRRWVGIGGIVIGAVLLVGVAFAGIGLQDYAATAWTVWWVGVAVQLIRKAPHAVADARL